MSRFANKNFINIMLFILLLSGCSTSVTLWREDALALLGRIKLEEGEKILPAEFKSIEDLVLKGELLLREKEIKEADKLFLLAWSKGNLLEKNLILEKQRLAAEAKLIEDAKLLEAQRKRAFDEEARKEIEAKEAAAKAAREAEAESRRLAEKAEKLKQSRERQLPSYHTVKRGESLPFIASQPEVYNDRNLWPLLYRANRDQISNPKHIWPGQVLRIPRNSSREDINEARHYSQERPLH